MSTTEKLSILKRKRTTLRTAITKLSTKLNDPNSTQADIEFSAERLQIKLNELTLADEEKHDFLNDQECSENIIECEKYSDIAHLLLFNSKKKANTSAAILPYSRIGSSPTSDSIHYASPQNVTVKLPTIDKHVFLRGYLDAEAKRLVDGISITADTYTMAKEILKSKYGNKDKIIQAHLDYLENLTPIKDLSPSALNELYIDCNRRLQALDALGEKKQSYGRILAPKILRAFPHEICRNWVVYAKRENLADSDVTKLMKFLSEEVEGTITANNIKGSLVPSYPIKSPLENFNVHSKSISKDKKISSFRPFCETSGHWPQQCNSVTDIDARIQKLKATNRCFLCTNRGHVQKNCFRKEKYCCSKCRKKHHVSIRKTPTKSATTSTNKIDTSTYNFVHLQTTRVLITGSNGITKLTRCLLDCEEVNLASFLLILWTR
ncbi:integrase catalytic domain-containing protein [Trichonephila clavata]|uniref:Integrase catalytic domain-containing protein n=1 Tax=Trichonephila clavata TaxID=2740835 RepID=A0A8X6IEL1_TRICU|nr:integrase catalytic domain-containing protein [Trichonephila clavata]